LTRPRTLRVSSGATESQSATRWATRVRAARPDSGSLCADSVCGSRGDFGETGRRNLGLG
jgi:hypothetical protein